MNRPPHHISASPGLSELAAELPAIAQAIRSPIPLFITAIAAYWAGVHTGQAPNPTIAYTLFAYLLSLLAITDLRHGILPHILTGTLATLGAVLAPTLGLTFWGSTIGALVAYAGLGLCALITRAVTGKNALGGGDLWLVFALGAWLGVMGLPMLLIATAVTGTISVLLKRWLNAGFPVQALTNPRAFPFGPALCAAGWLALLYAPTYWKFIEVLVTPAH